MKLTRAQVAGVALLLAGVAGGAGLGRAQEVPYVYNRAGGTLESGAPMGVKVESESAVGTREARPFGAKGFEQGVRLAVQGLSWLEAELWGGVLVTNGEVDASAFSGEARATLLTQKDFGIQVTLGAGAQRDFRGDAIGLVRLSGSRTFGRVNVVASGLAEVPFTGERDTVDLVMGLGAMARVSDWFSAGAEVLGEDLEGFWEEEEAEGGARLIAGPTLDIAVAQNLHVKGNFGLIYAMTNSSAQPVQGASDSEAGFLGRLILGYSF